MRTSKSQKGIILLSTILILTLLTVLVMQFSYSTFLEKLMAQHNRDFIQRELYFESAALVCQNFATQVMTRQDFTEETLTINLEESTETTTEEEEPPKLTIKFYDESGKFNLNALFSATSDMDKAMKKIQLQRLLSLLSEKTPTIAAHIAPLMQLMDTRTNPFKSLKELQKATSNPPEDVIENLRKFISTNDETRINMRTAPVEVIRCLDPGLDESGAQQLRQYFVSGQGSPQVRALANRVDRYTTLTGSSFGAEVELTGSAGKGKIRLQILVSRSPQKTQITAWERVLKSAVSGSTSGE